MGIYQYTLRAPTKNVGGVHIGQYLFGYKCGWGMERTALAKSLSAAAERAAYKNRDIRLFVQGKHYDGQPVFWQRSPVEQFTEELRTAPSVGYLCKDSKGRWSMYFYCDAELLNRYPEIGMLQTDQGRRYYLSHRSEQIMPTLYEAITEAMEDRLYNY